MITKLALERFHIFIKEEGKVLNIGENWIKLKHWWLIKPDIR